MAYRNTKLQAPNLKRPGTRVIGRICNLDFGISLNFEIWILGFLFFLTVNFQSISADLPPNQVQFFENKIRPILANNCYKCHSQQAEKVKAGLLLDTKEGVLKGGETGPAIVPGDPEKSLLIKAVRYTDPDLQMPPKGKKLSDADIANLVAWVKMGAPDPRVATARSEERRVGKERRWRKTGD